MLALEYSTPIHAPRALERVAFAAGDEPVPLALMGLNEGANVYVADDGAFNADMYIPAYARRYPFLLARLEQGDDTLSLCVDPTSDLVGAFDDGEPLFDGAERDPVSSPG